MNWLLFWLFLHITAAVIAFGPTFVFPLVGSLARRNPASFAFAVEVNHAIETKLVAPLAVSMAVSGVGLIFSANINVLQSTFLWVGILLYLCAIGLAFGVAIPTTAKLRTLAHAASGGQATPGPPPPQVLALVKRAQGTGMVLGLLFFVIIFLMIVQPGGVVPGPIFG